MVGIIGILDHITGYEFSFSVFYVIPVSLAVWSLGLRVGTLFSLLSAVVWVTADKMSGNVYSHGIIPFWNGFVHLLFLLIISYLLNIVRNNYTTMKHLSDTDSLTGVMNGRGFEKAMRDIFPTASRLNHILSIAFIDLDNFKSVNDRFGHSTGDKLLTDLAELMKRSIRQSDIVARMGGDEFVILLMDTDYDTSDRIMTRIKNETELLMKENGWPVTFSAGMITFKSDLSTSDNLIKLADEIMYEVKNSSKNGFIHKLIN